MKMTTHRAPPHSTDTKATHQTSRLRHIVRMRGYGLLIRPRVCFAYHNSCFGLLIKCKWGKRGGVKKRREGDKGKGRNRRGGKGGEKGDGRGGGEDLLLANKVNKITPTPQTSTGSARYSASSFNYSTISSASTMQKGRKKNKGYTGKRRNKCREKSKTKSAHLRRNVRQTPTPLR